MSLFHHLISCLLWARRGWEVSRDLWNCYWKGERNKGRFQSHCKVRNTNAVTTLCSTCVGEGLIKWREPHLENIQWLVKILGNSKMYILILILLELPRILISLSIIARKTLFKMLQKCVSVYVCSYVCISKSELITLFIRCAFEAKFLPLAHAYNIKCGSSNIKVALAAKLCSFPAKATLMFELPHLIIIVRMC